jgi:chemotaxis protein methyltransferase CheR
MTSVISSREFRLFQTLVHNESGIFLSDQKRALLIGRLAPRLRALSLDSFASYHERVLRDESELIRMLDAVCTNETQFFREPKQFAFLERDVLPVWRMENRRHVRVWSAACSTGEEPYSIAMTLAAHLPNASVEILATDLSMKVLERAAAGVWTAERGAHIPAHYLRRFMTRGTGAHEGMLVARPELKSMIRFARLNLSQSSYAVHGRFDLIFCRNVLIYFDAASKKLVIDRLLGRLQEGGLFFLGHAESLHADPRVRAVGPTVYALRDRV